MTPIVASTVQAMASVFHPFCFHCIFVVVSHLNSHTLESKEKGGVNSNRSV